MALEIERRFLLKPCPVKDFLNREEIPFEALEIEQYYLKGDCVIRYRKAGSNYYKTVKSGEGMVRQESEREVSKEEYLQNLLNKDGRVIKKIRYRVKSNNLILEIDEFMGSLEGLNILEVEFKSEDEANSYKIPIFMQDLILQEITALRDFSNKALSKSSFYPIIKRQNQEITQNESATLNLKINPFNSLNYLLKMAILSLLKCINLNRDAIVKRYNNQENLHQFRVALRKIRAIFSEFKYAFKEPFLQTYNPLLKYIMQQTNAKRDLDVFLINMENLQNKMDIKYKAELEEIKKDLLVKALKEEGLLKEFLKSSFLDTFLKSLQKDIQKCTNFTKEAFKPAIIAAKTDIKRAFKDILKASKELNKKSDIQQFHKIRIEFKKFRYLLELYSIFLPDYKRAEKELKRLQKSLGEIHDNKVEIEFLKNLNSTENLKNALKKLEKTLKKEIKQNKKISIKNVKKLQKRLRVEICPKIG